MGNKLWKSSDKKWKRRRIKWAAHGLSGGHNTIAQPCEIQREGRSHPESEQSGGIITTIEAGP